MRQSSEKLGAEAPIEPWILVLGTADWNQAIATNQHYMVRELAKGYRVTFVESMGLRRPQLSKRDLLRMMTRLRGGSKYQQARRDLPANCEVVSPYVIPFHEGLAEKFNRASIRRQLRAWASHPGPRILWAYTPVTYGLERSADFSVYHCVDLLGEFPGIDRELIHSNEKRLSAYGAQAAGSSEVVVNHLAQLGFQNVLPWSNVADVSVILERRPLQSPRADRAVFAGNLSSAKIDFPLIASLLDRGIDVHLAGPIAEGGGDSGAQVADLISRGAVYHGLLSLEKLADLYWTASVGLIPYLINDYTRGVNPLKTFEYLAAGLKVISSPVPAVRAVDKHIIVAESNSKFINTVVESIAAPQAWDEEERISIAKANSWDSRGQEGRDLIRSFRELVG